MVLNVIIIMCIIYSLVEIPFFLGNYNFGFNTINTINIIIDLFYIIDCVSQFFLPYYEDDILEKNLKKIIIHYLKSYFFIDFLSAIPLRTIFLISDGGFKKKAYILHQNQLYYLLLLLKLLKTIKVFNQNNFIEYISIYFYQYEHFNVYLDLYQKICFF